MLYQPQLPRPLKPSNISKWADITVTTDQLSTQDKNLRQYLQNYLTKIWHTIVPTAFPVSILNPGLLPYTVNGTDQFVAAPTGTINLPQASGSGRVITVKNIDPVGNSVTVTAFGTDTIDGGATVVITLRNDAIRLIDGALGQWYVW